eukprot:TRINITY_DN11699_c3_g1_i4.p1 TRINITY_DN11699_c3_g1~~TRINITY_DN11699_c3_g1_i4.p1  ORF type:complete len:101 (-),score=7.72 TRINITY_DN11699_c3_g1_i4:50-352(-)
MDSKSCKARSHCLPFSHALMAALKLQSSFPLFALLTCANCRIERCHIRPEFVGISLHGLEQLQSSLPLFALLTCTDGSTTLPFSHALIAELNDVTSGQSL